jgi:hypothetical protein
MGFALENVASMSLTTSIVSKGGEETLYVCRRLLSKSEYPFCVAHQHFIVERKEGETG